MPNLKVIIFNVEHGFCAFIKTPTGRSILIDCGKASKFSPIKYIVNNELDDCVNEGDYYFTKFILTHPHGDHLDDIDNLILYPPSLMFRQKEYNWGDVKDANSDSGKETVKSYQDWQSNYTHPASPIEWGITIDHCNYLTPAEASELEKIKMVNNSSIPVIINFQGTLYSRKFLIGGDLEKKGWEELLKRQSFRDAVKGTDFFITSHHGHSSGYYKELFDVMGKPYVNIVSARSRDENVESAYSTPERAVGINFNGQPRYMLSTRKDGSISIEVDGQGKVGVWGENFNENIDRARLRYAQAV